MHPCTHAPTHVNATRPMPSDLLGCSAPQKKKNRAGGSPKKKKGKGKKGGKSPKKKKKS